MQRILSWLRNPTLGFATRISIYSIGLSALWGPMDSLLLQQRVSETVSSGIRDTVLGLISFIGIAFAALIQPIAGHASDRFPSRNRRRIPIAVGSALDLLFLAFFGWAPEVATLFAAYLLLQFSSNVAQAAYQALIPDLVRPADRGLASGVKNGLDLIGGGIGVGVAGILLSFRGYSWLLLLVIGLLLAITAALDVLWTPPAPGQPPEQRARGLLDLIGLQGLIDSFRLDLRAHRSFALSVAVRFLFLLGLFPIQRFFLYFLESRFGQGGSTATTALFILGALSFSVLGALAAGSISDRFGRRITLRIGIVAAAIGVVGIALAPTLPILAGAAVVMALGLGAFQAVNWALLADFIPRARGARFYGLSNIATAAASALAGLFGPLITLLERLMPGHQYELTFLAAAIVTLASLIPLQFVPAGRPPARTPPSR